MEYVCINRGCKYYDEDAFENCDYFGICYDGHTCNKSIVINKIDWELKKDLTNENE